MVSFLQTIKLTTAILNQKLRSVYKKSPIGYKWQGHIVFLAAFIVQGFNLNTSHLDCKKHNKTQ